MLGSGAMRICVLNSDYKDSISPFGQVDSIADPTPYLVGHEVTQVFLRKASAEEQVRLLAAEGFDVYLNLCDGALDEDRPGIEVVKVLEAHNVAFSGANSGFFEPTRLDMKQACLERDIPTPAYVMVNDPLQEMQKCEGLKFPLIVKHPNSYGSIGLTRNSRVDNKENLKTEVEKIHTQYGSALVEEFISGREFTVLVAENPENPQLPIAFKPIEVLFGPGETYKHFNVKWVDYATLHIVPCADPVLDSRLREVSSRFFLAMSGTGYGRCDLRLDDNYHLHMLKINPNCGIFYAPQDPGMADYILSNDPIGHSGFVDLILKSAQKRIRVKTN